MLKYPPLKLSPRTGDEPFLHDERPIDVRLRDFWQWAVSDLVDNVTRGRLAEFFVATALGLTDTVRNAWSVNDLTTRSGLGIQVKSAAYLQAWGHAELSSIRFDVSPRRAWDYETNRSDPTRKRHADLYVFCVLHHQEKSTLDPMDLTQWTFYVLPTSALNTSMPTAKSISLTALLALNPAKADFDSLANVIAAFESAAIL